MFNRNKSLLMHLLRKSRGKPASRLLGIFDLSKRLDQLSATTASELEQQAPALMRQLTKLAKRSGAQLPEVLAQQILIMFGNALQQELKQPGCHALHNARIASDALIHAQCDGSWRKFGDFSMSASFVSLIGIGVFLGWYMMRDLPPVHRTPASHQLWNMVAQEPVASAKVATSLHHTLEQMRQGNCHFPQALMLDESERAVYLRHVVSGDPSSHDAEIQLMNKLIKKVSCEYKPLIMLSEPEQAFIKAQLTLPRVLVTKPIQRS